MTSLDRPRSLGDFRIVDQIAEGGMGLVYRAIDTASSRAVALKTTRRASRAETHGLLCEGAALGRLRHPGIVQMLARGRQGGAPWIALELLEGRTLQDEIDAIWAASASRNGPRTLKQRRLDDTPTSPLRAVHAPPGKRRVPRDGRPPAAAGHLGDVRSIFVQLAEILDHVHARGLVHRDIKPSNIFLRATDSGSVRVTLLDFGLACRATTQPRKRAGLCVGTMEYASPEQIVGDPVDGRADVYALGCVLYELITGVRPFEGRSRRELAREHLCRSPLPPSLLVSGLSRAIDELVLEMLAKDRAMRPQTAGAATARLERAFAS